MKFDYMCIAINPKHNLTYEFLLFKNFGGLKNYDGVEGAPAIAKYLDVNSAEEECKELNRVGLYKMFFLKKTEQEKISGKINLSDEDLKYFFVEKSDVFKNASEEQMQYVKQCYPSIDFSKIIS